MPIVCIQRPRRSVPRRWTVRDVARVARAARIAGATESELIAAVMESSPQRPEICEWIDAVVQVLIVIRSVIAVLSSPGAEEAIRSAERYVARAPIPVVLKAILIAAVEAIGKLASIAGKLSKAVERIDDLIAFLATTCGGNNAN